MQEEKGYDVLKLVTRGERCYVSTDYVKGRPLIYWLKYHAHMTREQLYRWMKEIITCLEQFHHLRGNPSYQYVNPCSIIVGEDGKLYLLDLGTANQKELLLQMQRRGIREHFLSPENQYYQKVSEVEDLYGLGKTLQYILSVADVTPKLSVWEQKKFKNIISRCLNQNSKKNYLTIEELSEHFPIIKEKRKIPKRYVIYLMLLCATVLGTRQMLYSKSEASAPEETIIKEEPAEASVTEEQPEEYKDMIYDMGLLYFLESEDYGNSRETFRKLEETDNLAADYVKLCTYLLNPQRERNGRELEMLLTRMEGLFPEKMDERYLFTLLKGYELSDAEESATEIIRLGKQCLEDNSWQVKDEEKERKKWLVKMVAESYEQIQDTESAIAQYQSLLELEENEEERTKIQEKIDSLAQIPL